MNIECTQCGSTEISKLSLIFDEGFSHLEAHSRGWGFLVVADGADLAFGRLRTTGEIQTQLSQKISPPHKWSYWKILFCGLIGLLVLEFILGYMDAVLRFGGNFNQQLAWFGYSYLGVVAITMCLAVRHNFGVFPKRYRIWDRSLMCRCCGHIFQLPETSDHAHEALIRNAL